jgi:bifunctional non-homologous end joining protein LigD
MAGTKKTVAKAANKAPKKSATKKSAPKDSAADVVDEQLARYRSMRDFGITAEPSGEASKTNKRATGLPFCVQKHAASHLHYDFRLGWNGVLKSWAIAKGPSYVTADKRLAVQVEDHPIEYGGFEGIIPAGQYGGGTVMLWDQGTWEPQPGHTDVDAGLRDGSLKFVLHGERLKGKWALIRMGGKWAKEKKPNWLLIKEHDEFERGPGDPSITEETRTSVVTGRTMEEIAHNKDHVWNSKDTAKGGQAWFRQEERSTKPSKKLNLEKALKGLPKESQPKFVPPELAQLAAAPPSGTGWLHELKLDGYRMQARKDGDHVQMLTRKALNWTARMRGVADQIAKLPVEKVTLDGELVALRPDGTTSFADLQASMQEDAGNSLTYFCFDLLHMDGRNTRDLPLHERKELLSQILANSRDGVVRLSEHLETGGPELLKKACALGAEGIISKRADSAYDSGRGGEWLKMKCLHEQELVVGGYTLPTNGIWGVGALLLGYYQDGDLMYAGRTGTGFTQKTHKLLRDRLEELTRTTSPFLRVPGDAKKGARWVKPEMVVQVRFSNWTADNLVRQAAFLGMREDKAATEVVREVAAAQPREARHRDLASKRSMKSAPAPASKAADKGTHAPVRLTHPDKVLDSESGLTKQMLADYYWQMADWMLPHIANRPLSLVRCPDGAGHPCFFQKHVNATLPKGIGSVEITDKTGKVEPYITLNSAEALAGLAQLGVLEVHPWGSKNDDLERPDRLIFDLDPDEALPWTKVTAAALGLKELLEKRDLESFVKTTGGKGLHVVVPIIPELEWPAAKELAHSVVLEMEKANPSLYLTKMTKAARKGKIYLDYLRNERGATAVAAYSPRARVGAAVSMPLSWTELKKEKERPVFHAAALEEWKGRLKRDPWKEIAQVKQRVGTEKLRATA